MLTAILSFFTETLPIFSDWLLSRPRIKVTAKHIFIENGGEDGEGIHCVDVIAVNMRGKPVTLEHIRFKHTDGCIENCDQGIMRGRPMSDKPVELPREGDKVKTRLHPLIFRGLYEVKYIELLDTCDRRWKSQKYPFRCEPEIHVQHLEVIGLIDPETLQPTTAKEQKKKRELKERQRQLDQAELDHLQKLVQEKELSKTFEVNNLEQERIDTDNRIQIETHVAGVRRSGKAEAKIKENHESIRRRIDEVKRKFEAEIREINLKITKLQNKLIE